MTVQETEYGFQEIRDGFRELQKLFQQSHAEFQASRTESERRFQASQAELEHGFRESRAAMEKLSAETDKKIGALTGKWSKFVEGLVAPAVERLFTERGIVVDKVAQRVKTHRNGETMEIDILALDGEYAVLIEIKSTLSVQDVKDHLAQLQRFTTFFPEYQGRKIIGAVAGIDIEKGADRFAYQSGLFVIAQRGDTVEFLNDDKFRPNVW